jgi:DNA-binding helix-hairpin-helix protein with protein kinase domain
MQIYVNERFPNRSDLERVGIALDESHRLGRGATASVYPVQSQGYRRHVAKIYHEPTKFNRQKIEAMLANPPLQLYLKAGSKEYPQFAWPTRILFDSAETPVGYLMPLISDAESLTLNHFFERALLSQKYWVEERSLTAKIKIAQNLSFLLAELHSHRHYVIDFKPQNIKVVPQGAFVAILDCDSFSIQGLGKSTFPATNFTSEYIAPEALRNGIGPQGLYENQDRFALAVVLFQLLNNGIHPFQGISRTNIDLATTDERVTHGYYPHGRTPNPDIVPCPQSIHADFDEQTRALFDRAFVGRPSERPSATEWGRHFAEILTERLLERCQRHPNDPTHIHFAGKPCGACHFDAILGLIPAASKVSARPGSRRTPTARAAASQSSATSSPQAARKSAAKPWPPWKKSAVKLALWVVFISSWVVIASQLDEMGYRPSPGHAYPWWSLLLAAVPGSICFWLSNKVDEK